jgi:dynein assembly factor 5
MDDANDGVRIQTCSTFDHLFKSLAAWQEQMKIVQAKYDPTGQLNTILDENNNVVDVKLDLTHYETIIKAVTLHMDDSNTQLQEAVCAAISVGAATVLDKSILKEHLALVRSSHRSTVYLDRILDQLNI